MRYTQISSNEKETTKEEMMKRTIAAIVMGLVFIAFTFMVKTYDVSPIGPAGTEVGFSHINQRVHEQIGFNQTWYDMTDYLGYAVLAVCGIFALAGLVQLIKRRSLLKVDSEILILGVYFVVVMGFYVLFEKLVINYRPVIMDGETMPEASYPSSHTMLVVTVMLAVAIIVGRYFKNEYVGTFMRTMCIFVTVVMVVGRYYSGVHWATDIVGGLLLSFALLLAFHAAIAAAPDRRGSYEGQSAQPASTRLYKPKH